MRDNTGGVVPVVLHGLLVIPMVVAAAQVNEIAQVLSENNMGSLALAFSVLVFALAYGYRWVVMPLVQHRKNGNNKGGRQTTDEALLKAMGELIKEVSTLTVSMTRCESTIGALTQEVEESTKQTSAIERWIQVRAEVDKALKEAQNE